MIRSIDSSNSTVASGASTGLVAPAQSDAALDPEAILNMLKAQLGPEAAQMLELLIAMLQSGQNPFAPPAASGAPPAAGGSAAGGPAHGASGSAHGAGGASGASRNGEAVDGGGGFLWKPVSESDGNLVVLLPPELRGNVDSVEIQDASGRVLDRGRFAGDQKNGGRPHFRFDRDGAAYGDGLKVVAKTKDGRQVSFDVGDGGSRHD